MAKQYRLGPMRRLVNRIVARRVRSGKSVGADVRLLTTVGRRTGLERTTPVTIVHRGGADWLVAPYGPVSWVHNLRTTGMAKLGTDDDPVDVWAEEVGPDEAAPVLKLYLTEVKVVRPFFDVEPEAPLEAFAALASEKPVFRIKPLR